MYVPGTSPTNAPPSSIVPWPGEKLHEGVSPAIVWPRESLTVTAKRTTSPCRAFARLGLMDAVTPFEEITCTLAVLVALPERAVIVADPGDSAVSTPSFTRTTAALEVAHVTASSRVSPAAERT